MSRALRHLRPPAKSLLDELQAIRCRIEGKLYNPTEARIGAKYPLRYMQGRDMAVYYPVTLAMNRLQDLAQRDHPDLAPVRDQAEVYAEMTRAYRVSRGKTPKPQSRRTNKKRKR